VDYPSWQQAITAAVAGLVAGVLGYFFGKRNGTTGR